MRTSVRLCVAALAVGAAVGPAVAAQAMPISMTHEVLALPHHEVVKNALDVVSPAITAAAWYQPDPLCSTPLGCGVIPLPPISPYPKGTYHVGTAVGRQIARAFIAVDLDKLAQTAHGGTLTIPLDTSTLDGSLVPQDAKVNVCVTYQAVTDVEGGFDNPPSENCLPAAHAKYVAKPTPRLVANLKPLGGKLAGVKGFALLPADPAPTTAWQIAFKLPGASAPATTLPTLKLLVGNVAKTPPTPTPTPSASPTHHAGTHSSTNSTGGSGDLGVGPVIPPEVTSVPPDTTKPVVAAPEVTKHGRFVTVGYQYPEVWLLPILALVLVPFTLRALTRDLTGRK